jgi:hypothetical protein
LTEHRRHGASTVHASFASPKERLADEASRERVVDARPALPLSGSRGSVADADERWALVR